MVLGFRHVRAWYSGSSLKSVEHSNAEMICHLHRESRSSHVVSEELRTLRCESHVKLCMHLKSCVAEHYGDCMSLTSNACLPPATQLTVQ